MTLKEYKEQLLIRIELAKQAAESTAKDKEYEHAYYWVIVKEVYTECLKDLNEIKELL